MNDLTPVRSKGEATRNELLAIAERLVLERGFAGTSLDDILAAARLTKGAFFYHFRNKADLARALVERYADIDQKLFAGFLRAAEAETSDPLEVVLASLRNFETFVAANPNEAKGCVFASYSYEELQFDPTVHRVVEDGLRRWQEHYRRQFMRLMETRPPRLPVSAEDLARTIMAIIQGGLVLARVRKQPAELILASAQFRNYVQLLFGEIEPAAEEMPAAGHA